MTLHDRPESYPDTCHNLNRLFFGSGTPLREAGGFGMDLSADFVGCHCRVLEDVVAGVELSEPLSCREAVVAEHAVRPRAEFPQIRPFHVLYLAWSAEASLDATAFGLTDNVPNYPQAGIRPRRTGCSA
jgi:hypothetical protein